MAIVKLFEGGSLKDKLYLYPQLPVFILEKFLTDDDVRAN
jgi:hypothetical protein